MRSCRGSLNIVFPFSFARAIELRADNDSQVEAAGEELLSAVLPVDVVRAVPDAAPEADAVEEGVAQGAAQT